MLESIQRVHLVGIGGAGLSAIAKVLIQQGKTVTGSDLQLSAATEALAALGAVIHQGHRAENLGSAELVVVSSAIRGQNPELVAARERRIPIVKRDVLLGEMMQGQRGIAVAGTHGKTTTTAMVAFCLSRLRLDPTFIVGGVLVNLGTNAQAGRGEHFVVEADEYDRMFLGLRPRFAIVTNVEYDHPDCFADEADLLSAFRAFVALPSLGQSAGSVILCGDSPAALSIRDSARLRGVVTYGFGDQNDYRIMSPQTTATGSEFSVAHDSRWLADARLTLPGRHNMLNACGALALCHRLGLDLKAAALALAEFGGTQRRFEVKGETRGVTVIDDYAHHPTEIRATLAAARERYGARRIWAVFQPHTYSRTRVLLNDFAQAFGDADAVILTEIFASRETDTLNMNSAQLLARMDHPQKVFCATLAEAVELLRRRVQPGDVVITLGAGDVNWVGLQLLQPAIAQPIERLAS
ncbi:MAG: UDP-N-acetylmuramate--L-alanine ligase [Chloroflexi bacterium]|nr:UDP-N-acetylmuramate--L-alanine ligase [Chloroflexota bacterium]